MSNISPNCFVNDDLVGKNAMHRGRQNNGKVGENIKSKNDFDSGHVTCCSIFISLR